MHGEHVCDHKGSRDRACKLGTARSNEHRHGYERQPIGQARRWASTTQEASVDEGSACAVVWREREPGRHWRRQYRSDRGLGRSKSAIRKMVCGSSEEGGRSKQKEGRVANGNESGVVCTEA